VHVPQGELSCRIKTIQLNVRKTLQHNIVFDKLEFAIELPSPSSSCAP
jgi:hypothetical protein